jgi:hypothetical protein
VVEDVHGRRGGDRGGVVYVEGLGGVVGGGDAEVLVEVGGPGDGVVGDGSSTVRK